MTKKSSIPKAFSTLSSLYLISFLDGQSFVLSQKCAQQ